MTGPYNPPLWDAEQWAKSMRDRCWHEMVWSGFVRGHHCKHCGVSLAELNTDRALPPLRGGMDTDQGGPHD